MVIMLLQKLWDRGGLKRLWRSLRRSSRDVCQSGGAFPALNQTVLHPWSSALGGTAFPSCPDAVMSSGQVSVPVTALCPGRTLSPEGGMAPLGMG